MNSLNSPNISNILCSILRALRGNVTPNLRAVYVLLDDDEYHLVFYYDKGMTEDEEELASLADTEFIADFPENKTNCTVKVLEYPNKIPKDGICVFLRWEPSISNSSNIKNNP